MQSRTTLFLRYGEKNSSSRATEMAHKVFKALKKLKDLFSGVLMPTYAFYTLSRK